MEPAALIASGHVAGDIIAGRYVLTSLIGEGGVAEVWRAEHMLLRQDVAMKLLKRAGPHERWPAIIVERFRFESQVAARLSKLTKRVVAVHDYGETPATLYVVMDLVTGRTLAEEIEARGHLSPEDVGELLVQLEEALEPAHRMGIVHRDLKPANILLEGPIGSPISIKVLDFGIAKSTKPALDMDVPKKTAVRSVLGTPGYLSPEQIRAGAIVDHRADIWAIGAVAYEALTGAFAFDGQSIPALMLAVLNHRPRPLGQLRAGLPKALDAWMNRCLEKNPIKRFGSVADLVRGYWDALLLPADASALRDRTVHDTEPRSTLMPSRLSVRAAPVRTSAKQSPSAILALAATVVIFSVAVFRRCAVPTAEEATVDANLAAVALASIDEPAPPRATVEAPLAPSASASAPPTTASAPVTTAQPAARRRAAPPRAPSPARPQHFNPTPDPGAIF